MNYLSFEEALVLAEAATGIRAEVLAGTPRIYLLDSALHVPQASFDGIELHVGVVQKAASLVTRIAKNHPLPDGNKRLAWLSLVEFCLRNDVKLNYTPDDAVAFMLQVASGECTHEKAVDWIHEHIEGSL